MSLTSAPLTFPRAYVHRRASVRKAHLRLVLLGEEKPHAKFVLVKILKFAKFKSQNPIEAFLYSTLFIRNTCFFFEVQWRRRSDQPPRPSCLLVRSPCPLICLSEKTACQLAPLKTALSRCVYYGCASDLHLYQTSLTKYILAKFTHTEGWETGAKT